MDNKLSLVDIAERGDGPIMDFDSCEFIEKDLESITLSDFTVSSSGAYATICIDGIRSNKKVVYNGASSSVILTGMLREHIRENLLPIPVLEFGKMDNVDESILEDAEPAVSISNVELYAKKGYVRGAIVEIAVVFENNRYGIIDSVYENAAGSIKFRFTNHTEANAEECCLVNDVNKDIFRMVEAEKGRIKEEAYEFMDLIDQKIFDIIFA
jgi:hypothetical protein